MSTAAAPVLAIALVRGVLMLLAMALVAPALLGEGRSPLDGDGRAIAVVLGLLLADAIGVNVALRRFTPHTSATLGWSRPVPLRAVVPGVVGFACCGLALASVLGVVGGAGAIQEFTDTVVGFGAGQRLTFVVIGVLGACVAEESLYRGAIQPALIARLGTVGGVVVTAVLFSVLHFNFHPVSLVTKALFGLIYGVLRWRTGNLWAAALTHALVWWVFGAA